MPNLGNLLSNPTQQFRDLNGNPLASGNLYSYQAGSTNPQATYTDATCTTPATNPVVLDANGEAQIWINSSGYKFVLQDSLGNTIWTVDNVIWINNQYITATMLANGSVGNAQLGLLAVATGNLQDQSVTTPKIADANVTTAKLADLCVTPAKCDPSLFSVSNFPLVEIVLSNKGDFSMGGIVGIPQYPWTAPIKLTDPATLPAGIAGSGAAWSPSGEYLAITHLSSPKFSVYQRVGTTLTKIGDPATIPSGTTSRIAWSPCGKFLAVITSSSPYIYVYLRAGNNLYKLTDPATLPTGAPLGLCWAPNSQFLAVAHTNSPGVSIYQMSAGMLAGSISGSPTGSLTTPAQVSMPASYTSSNANSAINPTISTIQQDFLEIQSAFNAQLIGALTKISDPAVLPAGDGKSCAWSSSGQFLAVTHTNTPYVTIYQVNGTNFTKLANPATLPPTTGACPACAWSTDEQFLSLGLDVTPFLFNYQRSGTSFTSLANPATLPTGFVSAVGWSPNGQQLACAHTNSPYVTIYSVSGTTFTKNTNPVTLPPSDALAVAFSPDGRFLGIGHNNSPYMTVYQTASTLPANALLWTRQVNNV